MVTGWRRAFCTTIPRDPDSSPTTTSDIKHHQQVPKSSSSSSNPSPTSCTKLAFFSGGGSNPTTPRLHSQSPRLRCRTTTTTGTEQPPPANSVESPNLHCKTNTPKSSKTPKILSNPSSPRSPLKLSLFRNSFKFRSSCGVCLNSVKTGQGTAIYTAECSHAFHFPCIASHVRKNGCLVCPVCNATWQDVPLLSIHKNLQNQKDTTVEPKTTTTTTTNNNASKPKVEDKKVVLESAPSTPKLLSDTRAYDDDEPLLSPTAGARFVPIPEVGEEEEEEEENEEFKGFVVNSSDIKTEEEQVPLCYGNRDQARNVQVKLMPESAVVSAGRGHETYCVALCVKAPPRAGWGGSDASAPLWDLSRRAPIDLVTVLDLSGSMNGAKLVMLKRAMRLVVSSLGSADRLSIVAFSACPKRLLPLRRMTCHGQRAARRIVDRLVCGRGNSVGDALRKATKVLEDRRERNPVASIMLLSDGQNERVHCNSGTNQRSRLSHMSSTRFAHIEIPVHSSGFGQSGGYSHEPAEDAFAECIGGLLSVVIQDLRVQLSFAHGSAPAEILAVYPCNGRPSVLSSSSIRLGDLYAEEQRELLVELRVPSYAIGSHHVMSVRCLYKDPATQEVVYGRDQALLVPRPHTFRSSSPKVERLRNLFITTRAIAESRRLLDHNDFSSAHHLLASSRALLLRSSSAASTEFFIRSLEAELAEVHWQRQHHHQMMIIQRRKGGCEDRETMPLDENGDPLTPTSAWRAAEKLANVAMMKKSLNRVSDLHGFENARF